MKNNGLTNTKHQDSIYYCKEFINNYYSSGLRYRASDLISIGLSPHDLEVALRRAMTTCRVAGKQIRKHFLPIYTSIGGKLVRDCKLSRLAYTLVLLNANVQNPSVARFQLKVLVDSL